MMSPKKKILTFLSLTFLLSFLAYLPILSAGTMEVQGGLFVLVIMWSPGLAALLTQLFASRSLRGLGWRLGSKRWLGLAYILPVLYALPVYAFTWLTGQGKLLAPEFPPALTEILPSMDPVLAVIGFILINATLGVAISLISALGEEIGWRGLFVPELAKLTTFRRTALISGAVWAVWHMPAIFLAGYNSGGAPTWYSAICFTILVLGISFPFAWLTLKSGSMWPAVLLHATHNLFIQEIFDQLTGDAGNTAYITGEFGVGLALTGLVTAYVFWQMRDSLSQKTKPSLAQPLLNPR